VTLGPDLTIRDLINEGRRVMSCLMSLVAGSQVIAMFVAGPVAEKAGIPSLYYGSAAMLVGIGIVGHFKLPRTVKAEAAAG
jgi:hypothetical protein